MTATITLLAEKGAPLSHTEMDNNFRALRNLVEVPTVAALRALGTEAIPGGTGTVLTQGCLAAGDGGGGTWWWDKDDSTTTDNTGTVVQATGVATGRWKRVFAGPIVVDWFGCAADGVTDDSVAIQKALDAGAGECVSFTPGKIYLATELVVSANTEIDLNFVTVKKRPWRNGDAVSFKQWLANKGLPNLGPTGSEVFWTGGGTPPLFYLTGNARFFNGTLDGARDQDLVKDAVAANALVNGVEYVIASVGTTNFTTVGATTNAVYQRFTATGPATGSGTCLQCWGFSFAANANRNLIAGSSNCHSGLNSVEIRGVTFKDPAGVSVLLEVTDGQIVVEACREANGGNVWMEFEGTKADSIELTSTLRFANNKCDTTSDRIFNSGCQSILTTGFDLAEWDSNTFAEPASYGEPPKMQQVNNFIVRNNRFINSGVKCDSNTHISTVTINDGLFTKTTGTVEVADGLRVTLTTTGALPTGFNTTTVYYMVNVSGSTFRLATTLGGTAIISTGSGTGTHSANRSYLLNSAIIADNIFDSAYDDATGNYGFVLFGRPPYKTLSVVGNTFRNTFIGWNHHNQVTNVVGNTFVWDTVLTQKPGGGSNPVALIILATGGGLNTITNNRVVNISDNSVFITDTPYVNFLLGNGSTAENIIVARNNVVGGEHLFYIQYTTEANSDATIVIRDNCFSRYKSIGRLYPITSAINTSASVKFIGNKFTDVDTSAPPTLWGGGDNLSGCLLLSLGGDIKQLHFVGNYLDSSNPSADFPAIYASVTSGSTIGEILVVGNTMFGNVALGGTVSMYPLFINNALHTQSLTRVENNVFGGHVRMGDNATITTAVVNNNSFLNGYRLYMPNLKAACFSTGSVATTVGAAGAASALPANPLGYVTAQIDGAFVKVPYYNP